MENSFLISILRSFTRKEMTYFKEFVYSPYFNKHEDVRVLTSILSDLYPNFTEKTCHPESLYKEMYGKGKMDKKKLALVFTYTKRQLENFMAYEIFKEEESKHKIFINKYLCKKEQFRHGAKQLDHLNKLNENNDLRDLYFLQNKVDELRSRELLFGSQGKLLDNEQYDEKQSFLEYAFLLEKLRDVIEQIARNKALKKEISFDSENFAISEVIENAYKYSEIPSLKVYIYIYRLFKKGDKISYTEAKEMITKHDHLFTILEKINLYTYLTNFCSSQINKGAKEYWNEIFSLYKILINREIIFDNGYLGEWYYKNIITVGTRLNEREWVEQFMEDYKLKLHPDRAENAYSFNKASYYFNIGELEKVLGLLLQVEYTDPRYSLGAKVLLLQTYFDLNEDEPLFSLTDSFRLFLKRSTILAASRKLAYANLFKLTKRLAKIRAKKGFTSKVLLQKDIDKLKRDFEKAESIYYKNWLKKKIEEVG